MAKVWVRDHKRDDDMLVYQDPVEAGCIATPDDGAGELMLWCGDPFGKEVAARLFLSPIEARELAEELLVIASALGVK
jgi:hypothetical protein